MGSTYKQTMPVVCLSLWLWACNSSNDAPANLTGGVADPGVPADGAVASDATLSAEAGGENPASTGAIDGSGGNTGGALPDGVGTTSGGSEIVGAEPIRVMQGEWATGCLEVGPLFRQQTLSVIGARMLMEFSAYSDQECTTPASLGPVIDGATVQRSATTVPTGETRSVLLGDATEVNFYFEQSTVDNKPLTNDSFPGRENYLEKIVYGLVLVDGDVLYFGDSDIVGYDGNSAQTRPISLNTLFQHNRVP